MGKKTKVELEHKKTAIKASRWTLGIFLLLEAIIVLMHFPGFLGVEWLEKGLIFLRSFLVDLLWPADAADMITYKGTVYEICTWFQKLPAYDLLVQVIIYLVPVLFVLTFVRTRILDWRIAQLNKPGKSDAPVFFKRIRITEGKKPSTAQIPKVKEWSTISGLSPQEARDANEYCERHQLHCDDPFDVDPGLRIQRLTGEIGIGESKDFVKPWDANGEIDLTAIFRRPVKIKLENGTPYIYTRDYNNQVIKSPVPMISYDPMAYAIPGDDGEQVVCIITWLGGL